MTQIETEDDTPQKAEPFAPGIYFGLDEALYHADPALGSTDIRKLAACPPNFWWDSRFNPDPDEDAEEKGDAKIVGTAMHLCVLEGREKFEACFGPTFKPGNIKDGKDERAAIEAGGRTPIKWKFYKRILKASAIVRGNKYLGSAFTNTIGTEVSVFWTDPGTGMPKKCRFDAVKPRAAVDLKSITNRDGIDFVELCRRHIGSYKYHVQGLHYMDGWNQMAGLIDAGAVFDAPDAETIARLRSAAAQEVAAFIFVFVQKSGAPLTWGTQISPANGIFEAARNVIRTAEENWTANVARFGLDTPWIEEKPLEELDINDIPAWTFR